ncbi:MAG: hypothetical protein SVG88_03245 [Halobacteriales archaeon]|nr:hypothetical protein [Halobacteriales archaeon]
MALHSVLEKFSHPAWRTAIGTGIAYLVLLGILFVLLFVLPYLLFL